MPLPEIDAERVAVFQGRLVRAGVGPHATRKAMILLGAILQRAGRGTPDRVQPAAASEREASILSVLGYAGLRPGELRILR